MNQFIVFLTTRIWQLAAVNTVAMLLSILGLGILGLAPALVAALWATHRLDNNSVSELATGMWREYKQAFIPTNTLVLSSTALIGILGFFGIFGGGLLLGLSLAFIILCMGFVIATLLVSSRIDTTLSNHFYNAKMAFLLAPYRHLFILLLTFAWAWAIAYQPLLGLYFALSIWALSVNRVIVPAIEEGFPQELPSYSSVNPPHIHPTTTFSSTLSAIPKERLQ